MKFLPSLSPLALVALALALNSCETANPANRRELYNSSLADSGPWHDYERRREAETVTGVSGGSAPTVVPGTRGRAPAAPPSSPLPAGTTVAPSTPAQITDSTSTGAPPVPVNPPSPVAATPDVAPPAPAPAAAVTPDAAAVPAPAATPASP